MSADGSPPAHLHGRQTHSNQMGSSHPRHDCVPKGSSGVDAEMRKERPRILDRDGLTHEMDESTDTTSPHTRSECGTDRSRNTVPYLVLDRVMAVNASTACSARFESRPAGAARKCRCGWPRRDCVANARTYVGGTHPFIDVGASAPLSQLRELRKVRRRTLADSALA